MMPLSQDLDRANKRKVQGLGVVTPECFYSIQKESDSDSETLQLTKNREAGQRTE
jgi:hypothetical protein